MTDPVSEVVFNALYQGATKEILNLVMACEKAFDAYGKRSLFGRDKGKEAEEKFTRALVVAILALERIGKIADSKNAEASFTAHHRALAVAQSAYPNWPRAYRYWSDFYAGTYNN